jgi:hypothetical protein
MKQKNYKYLTDEMKKTLDKEIKKIGRDKLYERVEQNIETQLAARLQNEEGAFDEVNNGPWRTTQWEYKFFFRPTVVDMDSLEQEMLYYIDRKRFLLLCGKR